LAVGSPAIAKPAEETPLIAAQTVAILREAGVLNEAVQLLPGDGKIGAALVADPRTCAVMFTGSNEVAKSIQAELSVRLNRDGVPVPLIAETGGQNALIVDSSALPEQVIADVLASAFDSAGQRCSALRVLCLQEDSADRLIKMLRGAMAELSVGNPDRLSTDIGPVITAEAMDSIRGHIEAMRESGRSVHQLELSSESGWGTFVSPTIIEIEDLSELRREVFGPVLHILRFSRNDLVPLVDAINAMGYGLTFGIHSRVGETIDLVTDRIGAGNIYVNRNIIGATVGVQPFGGHGLSGTGPKAGGPLYLRRLLVSCPVAPVGSSYKLSELEQALTQWLTSIGKKGVANEAGRMFRETPFGVRIELPGPVGEQNLYLTEPRGVVACMAGNLDDLLQQISAALATGNRALIDAGSLSGHARPSALEQWIIEAPTVFDAAFDVLLFRGDDFSLRRVQQRCSSQLRGVVSVLVRNADGRWPLELLIRERSLSINTAAAGGNASLMMIG
jgi:RHH-type proline utilization regulon transcriptional repressor/proline dehydrogenase/delta 1-pyrroline-5-carboxylate dehydrogenase